MQEKNQNTATMEQLKQSDSLKTDIMKMLKKRSSEKKQTAVNCSHQLQNRHKTDVILSLYSERLECPPTRQRGAGNTRSLQGQSIFFGVLLAGIFLPSWTWGPGPSILGKLARKSTKLGKLDHKKKEQVIYILTRFNLKFELNIWKIKHFIYNTSSSWTILLILASDGSHWATRLPNSKFSSFTHPGGGFLDTFLR